MLRREIRERSGDTNLLLCAILDQYQREGVAVPYTMDDFKRDFLKEHLKDLTPQERIAGLSPEELLQAVPTEVIERILHKRKAERPSRSRKPRRKP
jgi:hypothetical protein